MIGPGIANPMLWGSTDPLDGIGVIARSVRFRSAAGACISRTPASAGNRKKWGLRLWAKRGHLGGSIGGVGLFSAQQDTGNRFDIGFDASDKLRVYQLVGSSTVQIDLTSTRAFRDPAAHFELNVRCDTDAGGIVIEVNGEAVTMTGTQPAAGLQTFVNATVPHYIARTPTFVSATFDGYVSAVSFVDGNNPAASSYGQTHAATGQWRPKLQSAVKALVDAGGGNSYLLMFGDTTSLTTLCADSSAKGNNWTATNVSLTAGASYDSMLDTPTNNHPLVVHEGVPYGLVEGALYAGNSGTLNVWLEYLSTIEMRSGKWYVEVRFSEPTGAVTGPNPAHYVAVGIRAGQKAAYGSFPGDNTDSYGWHGNGAKYNAAASSAYGTATGTYGDILQIAYDGDSNKLYFGLNGTWFASSDPASGSNPAFVIPPGAYRFAFGAYCTNGYMSHMKVNFGQRPFAYTPPSGFKSLCTKNLPVRTPVMRAASAFTAVTDSGANVAATLAAAAPFSSWIRIYKRRDAAEGWRWQFSDDSANYLDSSSTAAKAAFPALAGSSYVGYALKVAAANGIATGRLTHVSGAADVVADGLATARKVVILKNEASGSWYVYHPDLTPGKLLYLEQVAAETADSSIGSVTASGFTVAAALPSGTYRWIALAEISGFLRLGKYTGNSSADGPAASCGLAPALTLTKVIAGGTSSWGCIDSARDTYNVSGSSLSLDRNIAEAAGTNYLDQLSNGFKLRQYTYNANTSGTTMVYVAIGQAFRYANAR